MLSASKRWGNIPIPARLLKMEDYLFVPIPILIVLATGFVVPIVLALRQNRHDPLLVGQLNVLALPRPGAADRVPSASLSPQVETQIHALGAADRKIEAIKLARELTGLGLKEAKDLVEKTVTTSRLTKGSAQSGGLSGQWGGSRPADERLILVELYLACVGNALI